MMVQQLQQQGSTPPADLVQHGVLLERQINAQMVILEPQMKQREHLQQQQLQQQPQPQAQALRQQAALQLQEQMQRLQQQEEKEKEAAIKQALADDGGLEQA